MSPVTQARWVTFGCYGTLIDGPASSGAVGLFDDVEGMLAELRRQGYRLAVLTNGDDGPFEAAHRRFRRPFDLFVTAERIRAHKPSQWHFKAFELLTRVERHDWVHVACSWYHDIAPARAFGLGTVWLDRDRTQNDASSASAHVYTATEAAGAIIGLFEQAGAEVEA